MVKMCVLILALSSLFSHVAASLVLACALFGLLSSLLFPLLLYLPFVVSSRVRL